MSSWDGQRGEINIGVLNQGSGSVKAGRATGKHVDNRTAAASAGRAEREEVGAGGADVGVLTVLAEECAAVVEVLRRHAGYSSEQLPGGQQVHRAVVPAEGGGLRVVALRSLDRGTESAGEAYRCLVDTFAPRVVLLVGVAGGIGKGVGIGDVVIADQVIYYDARRETRAGPVHRGRTQPVAAVLLHRVNEFFNRHRGEVTRPGGGQIRIHLGPIGTGNAVVTDARSDILSYLRKVNEKTLAVETEAGGVGQAFYERVDRTAAQRGWLTIRGISDLADKRKGHGHHREASEHAALVMEQLLPLLRLRQDGP
jgi:adenosylhomocysteine nucleosidase